MKQIIEDLFKLDRQLLGEGYHNALAYISHLLPLEVKTIKSGTKVGDWTIPNEWVIRDGWIKFNGEKLVDYKKNPLCITVYSLPINKKVTLEELKKHLHSVVDVPKAYAYDYRFYDRDWGFTIPYEESLKLTEGEYEVFIDAEDKKGEMEIGIHTIKGNTDKEILLFAHLDHAYMANDNLSGVACLIDMADRLHDGFFDHTIKLIFCPETIGSIAYAETQDISKVDFVLAVDSVGNPLDEFGKESTLMFQKSFDIYNRLNYCMHLSVAEQGVSYRKGEFRHVYGADEYYFNDPEVGIPGIFLTRLPFVEYHTSEDTPDKISEAKIKEVQNVIYGCIKCYESDFIPKRTGVKGVLMRSKHGIQTSDRALNRDLDYLFFRVDGKKWLSEIIINLGMGMEYALSIVKKLENDKIIQRVNTGKKSVRPSSKKK